MTKEGISILQLYNLHILVVIYQPPCVGSLYFTTYYPTLALAGCKKSEYKLQAQV